VYFWVDGIHVQARLEDDAHCLLVITGATPEGKKELIGLTDGVRENAQSWKELLLDLKRRGPSIAGSSTVCSKTLAALCTQQRIHGPRARGRRWRARLLELRQRGHGIAAVEEVWPQTRGQRVLQEIWMAETRRVRSRRSTPWSRSGGR
jgi:putative transposase